MRTTLNLNTGLLREAKRTAAERGTSLTKVLEQALDRYLHAPHRPKRYVFRPIIIKGRRPPAVDIADRNALYDFFDANP